MCTVCQEVTDVRYIDLYTVGSEGTNLCHACEMDVVGFIQGRMFEMALVGRARAINAARERRIGNDKSNL